MTQQQKPPYTPVLPSQSDDLSDDLISLTDIVDIIRKGKWWIFSSTVLFAVAALCYLLIAAPIYKSNATLELSNAFIKKTNATKEAEIIKSRFILGKVVEAEKLNIIVEPDYLPIIGKAIARHSAQTDQQITVDHFTVPPSLEEQGFTIVAGNNGSYELFENNQKVLQGKVGEVSNASYNNETVELLITQLTVQPTTRFTLTKLPLTLAIQDLKKQLSVAQQGNIASLLALSLSGEQSEQNTKTLNTIIDSYLWQIVEYVSGEAQNSLKFYQQQLSKNKSKMDGAVAELNKFQADNQLAIMPKIEGILAKTANLDTQLAQLDIQIELMQQRYATNHPVITELLNQKDLLALQEQEFVRSANSLPKEQQALLQLATKLEVSTRVYSDLLDEIQQLEIVKSSAENRVRVLNYPASEPKPIKPKKALVLVLATLLGAMFGLGIVFVRAMLNSGVKNAEALEREIGLAVYAVIPHSSQLAAQSRVNTSDANRLLLRTAPNDAAIESLRTLRTNLTVALRRADNNRVMITSPAQGVGKNFVVANLAELLAEGGKKVLLIDADLRAGKLHKTFNVQATQGLTEMLVKPNDNAVISINKQLDLISAGNHPLNPSELLMNDAFSALLEKVSANYDAVLINTPPVLDVTDAAIIGAQCATTLMLCRAGVNSTETINNAVKRLAQADVTVYGAVLNGVV